jgi:hypothetical protein
MELQLFHIPRRIVEYPLRLLLNLLACEDRLAGHVRKVLTVT